MRAILVVYLCCALPGVLAATSLSQLAGLSTSLESVAALSPAFSASTLSYTQSVPFASSEVIFTATAAQAASVSLWARWNAGSEFALTSGAPTAPLPLLGNASFNEMQIVIVSAEPNATYIVGILRSLIQSSNANLIGLQWRAANGDVPAAQDQLISSMTPANFSSQVFEYTLTLSPTVTALRFSPTLDALASLSYTTNEIDLADGTVEAQSAARTLRTGDSSEQLLVAPSKRLRLNTLVTAEDGTTTRLYRFTLTQFEDAQSSSTGSQQLEEGSSGLGSHSTSSSTGDHLGAADDRFAHSSITGQ